jgi:maleylpyruvate isomerase
MTHRSPIPHAWIEGCTRSHRRLEEAIEGLTDQMARRPSLLPDWTVGHLLTHLARNADSHTGMAEAAAAGHVEMQYPGGYAQREADIEAGQGRPAAELVADVIESNRRLERAWNHLSEEVWTTGLGHRAVLAALPELVTLRWREAEIHRLDLGFQEPDWNTLDPDYLDIEWETMVSRLPDRVPEGMMLLLVPGDRPSRSAGRGTEVHTLLEKPGYLVGWLFGRVSGPDWPELTHW